MSDKSHDALCVEKWRGTCAAGITVAKGMGGSTADQVRCRLWVVQLLDQVRCRLWVVQLLDQGQRRLRVVQLLDQRRQLLEPVPAEQLRLPEVHP